MRLEMTSMRTAQVRQFCNAAKRFVTPRKWVPGCCVGIPTWPRKKLAEAASNYKRMRGGKTQVSSPRIQTYNFFHEEPDMALIVTGKSVKKETSNNDEFRKAIGAERSW